MSGRIKSSESFGPIVALCKCPKCNRILLYTPVPACPCKIEICGNCKYYGECTVINPLLKPNTTLCEKWEMI